MAELRWALLALGVLLVAGIYLWSKGLFRRSELRRLRLRRRSEPHISAEPQPPGDEVLFTRPGEEDMRQPPGEQALVSEVESGEGLGERFDTAPTVQQQPQTTAAPRSRDSSNRPPAPDKVVTIRFVPRSQALNGEETVLALREAGLEHGRYGIFHSQDDACREEARFSVANLVEPGAFDLQNLSGNPIPGMTFFMVLPGSGDPVERFDAMVQTARALAHRLDAELFDDGGSSWSIQRERYLREELIQYRHQILQH